VITLDQAKQELRIWSGTERDSAILEAIEETRSIIEDYCGI
jgi:hypothetical protein